MEPSWEIVEGDSLDVLRLLPDACVDSLVTDPPAGIGFMGRSWDRYSTDLPPPDFLNWFAGFADGEGCFSVHKKRHDGTLDTYDCQFSITLRRDDKPILSEIQRTLGIGTVADAKAGDQGHEKARYCVSSKAHCIRLVEILRAAPLRAKKALDLEIWIEALTAWINHRPGEWADMADARDRLMESRRFTEYGKVAGPPSRRAFVAELTAVMKLCFRALKPGAHALVWALPRTSHWTATALEDAGFEIRDVVTHHFGTGFPKSLDVSKAIDKAAGAERTERAGTEKDERGGMENPMRNRCALCEKPFFSADPCKCPRLDKIAITDAAKQWAGWGTALKPGTEHWILVRKPFDSTVAENVLEHGTGALNIDASRIEGVKPTTTRGGGGAHGSLNPLPAMGRIEDDGMGRWPANVVFTHSHDCVSPNDKEGGACVEGCPVRELDAQSLAGGMHSAGKARDGSTAKVAESYNASAYELPANRNMRRLGDEGGASRFFYCAKPSTAEKEAGTTAAEGRGNTHPTVKSIGLMSYLVRLISPPGGLVLDPFTGSGTTGIAAVQGGWSFLGIEKSPEFVKIATDRIGHWAALEGKKAA